MDSVGGKKNLQEKGTRYDHYMELREVFMEGIDVLTHMNQSFLSEADKTVRLKLTHAVEMITRRIDNLSDFADKTTSYSDLARQIKLVGKHVTPQLTTSLPEGSNVEPTSSNKQSDSEDQGGEALIG